MLELRHSHIRHKTLDLWRLTPIGMRATWVTPLPGSSIRSLRYRDMVSDELDMVGDETCRTRHGGIRSKLQGTE